MIEENKKRFEKLHSHYDPLTGEGSALQRFQFNITEKEKIFLPLPMSNLKIIKNLQKFNSAEAYCKKYKEDINIIKEIINDLREQHDFEYYAFVNLKIQDKITKKIIPFKLNQAQRRYLKALEEERTANRPIRIDLLKTRQWGGSTLTENYFFWIQDKWQTIGWHSVLVGDVEQQAKNMLALYKRAVRNYPKQKQIFKLSAYEGSSKNRYLDKKGCIISIGSMQNPDSLRSSDNAMLHATEIGLWKATQGKKPEDLLQTLVNSIELLPYTIIVRESTAKGVGNYWHREWLENKSYKKVFVSWYEVEKNTAKITDYNQFVNSMNEYDKFLWDKGATLEGIHWYKLKLAEMGDDKWRMQSENPTTETEAFQSTGNRVFPPQDVEKMRKFCYSPTAKGKLFAADTKGKNALTNISFAETQNGDLWVWEHPENIKMKNRYIVVVDIGGKTEKADYSVITVLDRHSLLQGGVPQIVARCRYHIDQDILAWDAARIAAYYNNALLVIENNSLRKKQSEEVENHFTTVLNEIEDYYDNLYTYENPEKVREGVPVKWGFHTNASTKPMVINALAQGLRNCGFIDPDIRLYNECDTYEIDQYGAYNAVDGQHDDIIMSTAIGIYVSSKMDAPAMITATTKNTARANISLNI
jgi:hypothetical protein